MPFSSVISVRSPKKLLTLTLTACLGLTGYLYGAPCDSTTQICALTALIAQYPTNMDPTATGPGSLAQLQALLALAPNLTQIHLRIEGWVPTGESPSPALFNQAVNQTVQLVTEIRALPGFSNITLGFHPDNDQHTSAPTWGCAQTPTAECVFSNSIAYMNAVNQALSAKQTQGFTMFSIEQSYIEPQDQASVAQQKICLSGTLVAGTCTTAANPTVQYGYTSPSCGAGSLYDSQHFDYGYPQMYNLTVNWTDNQTLANSSNNPLPLLKPSDYPNDVLVPGQKYALMDAIPWVGKSMPPQNTIVPTILNPQSSDIRTVYEPNMFGANTGIDVADAAKVVATVMVKDIGTQMSDNACGNNNTSQGIRYFTFSGEPEFLGGNYDKNHPNALSWYWTSQDLVDFFNDLTKALQEQGVDTSQMHFAIWSYDTMLLNPPSTPS